MTVRIALLAVAAIVAGCTGAAPGSSPTVATTTQPTLSPVPSAAAVSPPPAPTAIESLPATAVATASADPDVIAAITVGSGPCAMVKLDGSVWVTNYSDGTIVRVDGSDNAVAQTVSLGLGSMPCGVTAADGKLWVGALGQHALLEVDPSSGAILKSIDIGGPAWDVQSGFDSVWVSVQGPDKILRVDPADGSIRATIKGGSTVSGLAVTPDEVWVANQGGTTIDRIDPGKNKITGHVTLPEAPFWFAVGDGKVLASLTQANAVVVVDAQTGTPGDAIEVGEKPHDPGFVAGSFWMPNQFSGDVTVIDPSSGAIRGSFTPPGATGVFLADAALGDGWILDYAGTTAYRMEPNAGVP